jgi:ribosome-associated protein
MMGDDAVVVTKELSVPLTEFEFRASTGGGPGGQHVNRSATRIELWWNPTTSPSLTGTQRALVTERLAHRLDRSGRIRVVSGSRRSQLMNREAALARLAELIASALRVAPKRRKTRPTKASVERRLVNKRRRSTQKQNRGRPRRDDE